MPSVDNRVVNMEFNNASFEAKIASTMKALDALEKSLKLEGAKKGLQGVSDAAGKVDLSHVAQGAQGISKSFLAMSTVAITALANITNRAINAGLSIAKSLSLEGVLSGFREYELNMNSIQTILSNTKADGTNLQQVNAALDQLNTYADKTIYNFGQMTRNIGTFTAAGVKLDVALPSIKGIANLAAMSGSSAEQASTAMYQLSQAISTGSLKLMDWNSVVNAGMGGKVFQNALFEAGKAMKTLNGVPIDQTFDQWTASGHNFRESLQDGWITADVLTTTLGAMSGEMDAAKLKAKGFSDAQIKAFIELGQSGLEAATKVRTFTGLVSTLKESIGSGWSASFRTIIGNFDEATNLWTGLSNTIGGFLGRQADIRNMTLLGAKQGGAMLLAIDGLRKAFGNLMGILRPIGQAFRDVFPRKTAQDLVNMARGFNDLMSRLKPSPYLIIGIRAAFRGLFSVLSIGWTIIKEGAKFIGALVSRLIGLATSGHGAFNFVTKLGYSLLQLKKTLVDGGGIAKFFDDLLKGIDKVLPYIRDFIHWIGRLFSGFKSDTADKASESIDRVGGRLQGLKGLLSRLGDIFDPLWRALGGVGDKLEKAFDVIRDWFKQLGQKIADNIDAKDFNAVLDSINTALLGGIALMIGKWMKGGLKVDVGDGLFGEVKNSFKALTGTLTDMQRSVKAETIKKIAIAVGILTASVVALSLIDSANLTKALAAMTVGFGQLLGAFAILNTMTGDLRGAARFTVVAVGLNLLAASMVTLSVAMAILGTLSWEDIAKGLSAITALLLELTIVSGPLAKNSLGMVAAGVGITALAVGLNILAGAVKLFSMMSWGEIGKGLVAIAGGLVIIAATMSEMPATMPLTAAGVIEVAIAMNILAAAVKIFATMSWGDLGKGAAALAGALIIIAATMSEMPLTLPITAAGMVILANALVIMGGAMKLFASMDWGEIGKSLTVLAGSMLILGLAMNAMSGTLGGAAALLVTVAALGVLQKVLKSYADMKWGDIAKGLGAIAVSLLALGLMATTMVLFLPALVAMGVALAIVSAAFLIFGAAALLTAKAFKIFADSGEEGAKAFLAVMMAMGQAIPQILAGLAKGIVIFILEIAKGVPPLVAIIAALLDQLLDTAIKLIPKFVIVASKLIQAFIDLGYTKGPQLIALGLFLIVSFLQGLDAAMPEIATRVINIINTFLLILAAHAGELVTAGFGVLLAILQGIDDNLQKVIDKGGDIVAHLITGVAAQYRKVVDAGVDAIVNFIKGVDANLQRIIEAGKNLIIHFIQGIGAAGVEIANAAADAIVKFVNGLTAAINSHAGELRSAGERLAFAIADGLTGGLLSKSKSLADAGFEAGKKAVGGFIDAIVPGSPSKVTTKLGEQMGQGLIVGIGNTGNDIISSAERVVTNAMAKMSETVALAGSVLGETEEFNPVITPVLDLSRVQADAARISDYIERSQKLAPNVSSGYARAIATNTRSSTEEVAAPVTDTRPVFEQTINAPHPLSASDIYKQTRNLITFAKEDLKIP